MSLRSNARTAQTYLAGLGASGALIAGAIVIFLILVAVVTFDAWPGAGGLFGDDSETIEVTSPERPDAAQAAGSALAPATLVVSGQPLVVVGAPDGLGVPGPVGPGGGDLGGIELVTSPPVPSPGGVPVPPPDVSGPGPDGGGGGGGGTDLGGAVRDQVNELGEAVGRVVAAVPGVVTGAVEAVDETVDQTLDTVDHTLNRLAPGN